MNLLIADRVLLTDVSWNDLHEFDLALGEIISIDGWRYRCRLLRLMEWAEALHVSTCFDRLWHWKNVLFWGIEKGSGYIPKLSHPANANIYGDTSGRNERSICGKHSPLSWDSTVGRTREANLGFRPVLELLGPESPMFSEKVDLEEERFIIESIAGTVDPVFYPMLLQASGHAFKGIPDGSEVKMYALLCNGKPVRQNKKIQHTREQNPELILTDKFYGENYLISWTESNGIAIASRPIMKIE